MRHKLIVGGIGMTNLEKIQKAIELMRELKDDTRDDSIVQAFIDSSITGLEALKKWIKN